MATKVIPFNQPYLPEALHHLTRAIEQKHMSGHGPFTKKCHEFFHTIYHSDVLLTTSCTTALEMAALLTRIESGDEVIIPSFSFTSSANPFILRGGKIVFADTTESYPNLDVDQVEELITEKTKAIVCMHYAGVACEMNKLTQLADKYQLNLIEDAAHALDARYQDQPLGTFGRFGTLSFHETKNITSGKGGLLIINLPQDMERAHIVWEKGTNRVAFHRKQTDKYEWMDVGSSYLASDLNAAVLYSQVTILEDIQYQRVKIWNQYYHGLQELESQGNIRLPQIPDFANVNGHLFFMECDSLQTRDRLIKYLVNRGIQAVFHYLPLHQSPFFKDKHDGRILDNTIRFSERIVRLPLYYELQEDDQDYIIESIQNFYSCTSTLSMTSSL